MSVSRQIGAAQCWSCAGAKWVSCSPLPVAPGEEKLCWGFSGTGFKTQVVLVKQGWYVECLEKAEKRILWDCLTARYSWMFPGWQVSVTCYPKSSPKAKSSEQHCNWFVLQPAQGKPEVFPSTT